jgi:hypothetical protein
MKLRELMENLGVPPMLQTMVSLPLAMKGIDLDADIRLQIDRAAERVRISVAGTTVLDATFDQIEQTVPDDGAGPAVDDGRPAGPGGVPG